MVKVLHVLDHTVPVQSGYSFRSRYLCVTERSLGIAPVVVSSARHPGGGPDPDQHDGIACYRTPLPASRLHRIELRIPFWRERVLTAALARRIVEVARIERPDILHAHSPFMNGLAALRAGRILGLPVVYQTRAFWEDDAVDKEKIRENGFVYRQIRRIETSVYRRANHVIAICEGLRRDITGRGIDPDRVSVIGNGVDPATFRPRDPDPELLRRFGLEGRAVVGFIGSFFRYEGLPALAGAAAALRGAGRDVRFVVVGGGEDEARLRDRIAGLGVGESFVLPGRVPHAEIDRWYSVMDLLVYPRVSRRLTELVTPLKPLEAMAMARPVLGSDVGGIRELFEAVGAGRLFRAGDDGELAGALAAMLADRDALKREGAAAREAVLRTRTWAATVAPVASIYAGLAGRAAISAGIRPGAGVA